MTDRSAGVRARPIRGRRVARPTGDDRELAILATAERLLAERPLTEISIDDLARGAGISRPTFYFYFRSKDAVLLTLLDRVVEEADAATADVLTRLADGPAGCWRACLDAIYRTFLAHRAVALASAAATVSNPEVRDLWATVMEGWISQTADAIQAERDRGAAPDGTPARDLAVALNLMNERVLYATLGAESAHVAAPEVVDVLLDIWLHAIYAARLPRPPSVDPTGKEPR